MGLELIITQSGRCIWVSITTIRGTAEVATFTRMESFMMGTGRMAIRKGLVVIFMAMVFTWGSVI